MEHVPATDVPILDFAKPRLGLPSRGSFACWLWKHKPTLSVQPSYEVVAHARLDHHIVLHMVRACRRCSIVLETKMHVVQVPQTSDEAVDCTVQLRLLEAEGYTWYKGVSVLALLYGLLNTSENLRAQGVVVPRLTLDDMLTRHQGG